MTSLKTAAKETSAPCALSKFSGYAPGLWKRLSIACEYSFFSPANRPQRRGATAIFAGETVQ